MPGRRLSRRISIARAMPRRSQDIRASFPTSSSSPSRTSPALGRKFSPSTLPITAFSTSSTSRRIEPGMARTRQHSVIPGFGLTLGYTVSYLSLIVLIPLAALAVKGSAQPWAQFREAVFDPRTMAAWRLTLGTAFVASVVDAFFGLIVAWTLVRYDFPGRRFLDALIDVPFALPTAVSGIALTAIYSPNGWLGRWLQPLGIKAAFSPLGIVIALTFIGLPFIVRTLQPAVEDLDPAAEEAASLLGASRWMAMRRVILPALQPA